MSGLRNRLSGSLNSAIRANDTQRKLVLRGVLASIKQTEVDSQIELDDLAIARLFQKEVKCQQEALADAETANRSDLLREAQARITILQEFLPQQLTRDEIATLAHGVIAEVGADAPHQLGEVMKLLMPQVQGRADGKLVSSVVFELLQASSA